MLLNVAAAALQSAQSKVLRICVPTRFGIKLYPPLSKDAAQLLINMDEIEPQTAPRAILTVPFPTGTSSKSLYAYSLRVTGGGSQQEAVNGQKWGLNGY